MLRSVPKNLVRPLAVALIAVPALLLLLYIRVYGVNGPEWDHLNSAEIFDRWDTGTFTAEYLFRPHNEHRKAVPRLVILGLGLATRFNNRAEMHVHWALLCATSVILGGAFLRERSAVPLQGLPALISYAPISALVMSARPYESILGDGFPTFLSLMFVLVALNLLAFRSASPVGFIGAICCGLCASFSQSNGLLIWPIGLLVLLAEIRVRPRRALTVRAILWTLAGAATVLAYFHGYRDPGNHPTPSAVLSHPVIAAKYFLALGGSNLAPERSAATILGTCLLILAALLCAGMARTWWRERSRIPFGFWLVVTAVATSFMITVNRADAGADPIVASRYTPFSALAPIGLYWIATAYQDRWRFGRSLTLTLAALLAVGYLAGTVFAWSLAPSYYSGKAFQSYLVYTAKYQTSSMLAGLYPNPDHARVYSAILERLRLNVFADHHPRAEDLLATQKAPPYTIDLVNGRPVREMTHASIGPEDPILVAGWAFDEDQKKPATAIFLTIDAPSTSPATWESTVRISEDAFARERSGGEDSPRHSEASSSLPVNMPSL
jgi:hypothetical protein